MSLRDLGVINPLLPDNLLIENEETCWKCGVTFGEGDRVALCPIQTSDETGMGRVECKPVCATCHLKGVVIMTPSGRRVVERIKSGDGSPFPVLTTDGKQWKDEEVGQEVIEK